MISRFKPGPVTLALLLALALIAWMVSGAVTTFRSEEPARPERAQTPPTQVEVSWMESREYAPRLVLQGQIEPWLDVELGAQIAGTVEVLPLEVGSVVRQGDVVARLSVEDRAAQVARFDAEIKLREGELAAAERLRGSGMQTETEILRLASELARARAEREAARLALAHTRLTAPFDAVLDRLHVERGDFVQAGTPVVLLVAIDRLKVTAQVPQQDVAQLEQGQDVDVDLLDGRRLRGELYFIASAAEPGTRSFRVEVEIANPQRMRIAGASATLAVHLAPVMAHRISPALLALDEDGRLGVSLADEDSRVRMVPVRLLSADNDGAWIAGLPSRARVITRGAGFVANGEFVVPVEPQAPGP